MQKWKELIETKTPESLNFLDVTGFCTTTKLKQRRWSYDSYGMTDIKRKRTEINRVHPMTSCQRFLLIQSAPIETEPLKADFKGDRIWHGETDIAEYSCNNDSSNRCSSIVDKDLDGQAKLNTFLHTDQTFQDPPLPMDKVTILFKVNEWMNKM